jgi:hypothetical protein
MVRRETVSTTSKLEITVAADIDSGTITLAPGELTARSVQAFLPLASKAATLAPGF